MENQNLLEKLQEAGVDVTQAVDRFMGNDELFVKFMRRLPEVLKLSELEQALADRQGEDFYMYMHDLKGVCGNLGIRDAFDASQAALVEYRSTGLQNHEKMQGLVQEIQSYCHKVLCVLAEDKEEGEM